MTWKNVRRLSALENAEWYEIFARNLTFVY